MSKLELAKIDEFSRRSGPLVFIIMDGVGLGPQNEYNAYYLADTPYIDKIQQESPQKDLYTELKAHGTAVGLPTDNEMGNSEVGHNAFGSGRMIKQRATLAKEAIFSKSLFEMKKWTHFTNMINKNNKTLHYIGLLSDGYVHSHIDHLIGLLHGAKNSQIERLFVHPLLDGRDVPSQSALEYIDILEKELKKINDETGYTYRIGSGGGRMRVTMDRYKSDWDVVQRGWEAHVCGIPEKYPGYKGYFKSAERAITSARQLEDEISDQYLPSFVIVNEAKFPIGKMENGDGVLFFNFRGDRAIQISRAFDEDNFSAFDKKCDPNVEYYGLLEYDKQAHIPEKYFIEPPKIDDPITKYLCAEKVSQFATAETHKYGHVTYFWNGNNEGYICKDYEKYVEIESDPSEMIEENPKMKAYEVKDEVLKALNSEEFTFLRVNFANGDMVGHTGNIESSKIAIETVDECVKEVVEKVSELGGVSIITADHGNLEDMSPEWETSHTCNPVMFSIVDPKYDGEYIIREDIEQPALGNVAATILNLLGYEKPEGFFDSLLKFRI
ncbi:MAG: 2,3-bisphosphoglycerate-independent phosphoglycerate mutase [Promethearchaeia archaeon]